MPNLPILALENILTLRFIYICQVQTQTPIFIFSSLIQFVKHIILSYISL